MTLAASPRSHALRRRARFGALVMVALLMAHDAMFVARFGPSGVSRDVLDQTGHAGWWTPYAAMVTLAACALALGAALRLRALGAVATSMRRLEARDRASFVAEWRSLAGRMLPAVLGLLLLQENVEHLLAEGGPAGLEPLASPLVMLAVAGTVLAVAAVGALVRWRIAVLEARVRAPRAGRFPRPASMPLPRRSNLAAAGAAHRRLVVRDDPGRAPPLPAA